MKATMAHELKVQDRLVINKDKSCVNIVLGVATANVC